MSNTPHSPAATVLSSKPSSSGGAGDLSPELQREINSAMDELIASGAAAGDGKPARKPGIRGPRVVQAGREMRSGTVVSVGPTDVFLEFGPKELGIVARTQWPEGETLPAKNDKLEVVVNNKDADGLLICSRPGTVQKAEWELLEPGQVIEARVTGVNKGGLDLEVAGHRAFMPAGQVSLEHIPDLNVFVGEKMTCSVVRVERSGRGNIVLSRKDILMQERRKQAEQLKTTLAEGQTLEGTVRKIMPFGAFVDLGGIDGLVHSSDLTHDRQGHGEKFVEKYVKVGEKVKVQILKLDWEGKRISLGMKQTQADPFQVAAADIKEGVEVTGRVVTLAEFGAFVEIAPGVEGLVHISELAWKRVNAVGDVLKKDEVIRAKVLRIDPQTRRISLSIKALTAPPEAPKAPEGGQPGAEAGGAQAKNKKQKPLDIGFGGVFGRGGRGRGRDDALPTRSAEEINKDTPELRRLREKFGKKQQFKGGIA